MSSNRKTQSGAWRRRLVLAIFAVAALTAVGRAIYLQAIDKDFLQRQGQARSVRIQEVPAHRGLLLDRHGQPLAVSTPVDSVWADPHKLIAYRERLPDLARALGIGVTVLEERLRQRVDREFLYLKRHVEPKLAKEILGLGIPGVDRRREYRRFYPDGEVTSQLLGRTDIDDIGQEGIELAYEAWLSGEAGSKRVLRDGYGRTIKDLESLGVPEPGKNMVLSIDRRLQYVAYRALKAAVIKNRARGGNAVLLDAHTGEVLAMVNQPAANPNDRRAVNANAQRNRVVTDLFEPGSTVKPFTVAAGLEAGVFSPRSAIDTNPGHLRIGGQVVRDVRNFGALDVAGVIRKSSNVGISKLALMLPEGALWSLYSRLGFGQAPTLGFPGERLGELPHYSTWSPFETATHAFGYGHSVSSLQLAQAYLVLASDGIRRPLSYRKAVNPPPGERVLSVDTARTVRDMMRAVVQPDGTAPAAKVFGYSVAGKTGTVKKNARQGGYTEDRFVALFAGMAPAGDPRLVLVVMIDDPRGEDYYGGKVAAPIFSAIMAGALRLLNVPPDELPVDQRISMDDVLEDRA